MMFRAVLACACLLSWPSAAAAQASAQKVRPEGPDSIVRLVAAIEDATQAGNAEAVRALAAPSIMQAQLSEFVQSLTFPRAERCAVKERDRDASADGRVRLLIETFTERGGEGRVGSWRMDVAPRG